MIKLAAFLSVFFLAGAGYGINGMIERQRFPDFLNAIEYIFIMVFSSLCVGSLYFKNKITYWCTIALFLYVIGSDFYHYKQWQFLACHLGFFDCNTLGRHPAAGITYMMFIIFILKVFVVLSYLFSNRVKSLFLVHTVNKSSHSAN